MACSIAFSFSFFTSIARLSDCSIVDCNFVSIALEYCSYIAIKAIVPKSIVCPRASADFNNSYFVTARAIASDVRK